MGTCMWNFSSIQVLLVLEKSALHLGTSMRNLPSTGALMQNVPSIGALSRKICPPTGHLYENFALHWSTATQNLSLGHLYAKCALHWGTFTWNLPSIGHFYANFALHWGTCTQNLPFIGALARKICHPLGHLYVKCALHMHTKFCLTKRDSWPKSRAPWSRWVGHGPCGRPFVSAPNNWPPVTPNLRVKVRVTVQTGEPGQTNRQTYTYIRGFMHHPLCKNWQDSCFGACISDAVI